MMDYLGLETNEDRIFLAPMALISTSQTTTNNRLIKEWKRHDSSGDEDSADDEDSIHSNRKIHHALHLQEVYQHPWYLQEKINSGLASEENKSLRIDMDLEMLEA
jgi:hypothetical protein